MAKVLFRCDATIAMGGGHVMRCLTLADSFKAHGLTCVFMCNENAGAVVPALVQSGYEVIAPELPPAGTDLLVVDHYGIDSAWESECRGRTRAIAVLDDLADRTHDCDLLSDQTLGREAGDYHGLVPSGCRVLSGPSYALLRPEFAALREETLVRRRAAGHAVSSILVSFGSADADNATGRVLIELENIDDTVKLDIVLGPCAPHRGSIDALADRLRARHDVRLHIGTRDMAFLMSRADLAIGAGGTTSWERCCLGLPSVIIVQADNQNKIAQELGRAGAALAIGPNPASGAVSEAVNRLRQSPEIAGAMTRNAASICDGRGAARLYDELRRLIA